MACSFQYASDLGAGAVGVGIQYGDITPNPLTSLNLLHKSIHKALGEVSAGKLNEVRVVVFVTYR
jgi:hypothetical protein